MDECVCMNVCNVYVVCYYECLYLSVFHHNQRLMQFLVPTFYKKGTMVCAPYVIAYVRMR